MALLGARTMLRRLFPDPFIAALVAAAFLAIVLPVRGQAAVAVNVLATASVVALFFLHGVKLSREAVRAAVTHWRLHLAILAATFVLFPVIGFALSHLAPWLLPASLWIGVLFICALPSTVQSSVAFTGIAHGNVAAAVAAAAASSVAGIFLTPLIVTLMIGAKGGEVPASSVLKIAGTLLLPFVLGQLARPWLSAWAERNRRWIGINDRATVLLSVYGAFAAATVAGVWAQLSWPMLGLLVLVCAVLLAIAMILIQLGARALGFSREDRIAIQFAGSKKSIISGVPMARILFPGPDLGLVTLPLMLFHQLQLMVCAELARRWGREAESAAAAAQHERG